MKGDPETPESTPGPQSAGQSPGITQAAFAARRGVSEAMVSRWKSRGLLVLDVEGRVLEGASNARLDATLDPGRGGDRTGRPRPPAAQGGAGGANAAPAPSDGAYEGDPDRMNYQREAARDKRASAMQRELELAREARELLPAPEVTHRIAHHVRMALDALASRRRRLAPKLALETDPRQVEKLLEESDREFCVALAGLALPRDHAKVAAA